MKICIVSSAGGHIIQCLKLLPVLKGHKIFIITFTASHLKKSLKGLKVYQIKNPRRNIKRYIKYLSLFFKILKDEKPRVLITTGAGVAVPICFLGKFIFKSKLIFIESFSRIKKPSLTGKILYPIADLFFVQWKYLLKKYGDKAIYKGSLL